MESTATRPKAVEQIAAWLRLLMPSDPSAVFEVRALGCSTQDYRRPHDRSGYFDVSHIDAAADAAAFLTRTASARGVYFTLNPLSPALLARRANRVDVLAKGEGSSDSDVLSRRWLLIDCDPSRPSGISASDAEHAAAKEVAVAIRNHLHSLGWPDPILADSGNGWHLLYRVDLPATDGGTVQRCLHALAERFGSPSVGVDKAVFNPSRICKLYGTFGRKGDHTEDRPHRLSRIIRIPENGPQVVPVALLESLAGEAPQRWHRKGDHKPPPSNSIIERARRYAAAADPSISGQHGHDTAYKLACALRVGFALSLSDALSVMSEWNDRCSPPWSEAELTRKLEEAERSADDERGWLLRPGNPRGGEQERLNYDSVTFAPFDAAPRESTPSRTVESTIVAKPSAPQVLTVRPSHPAPAWQRPLIAVPLSTEAIIVDDDPHRLAEVFLRQHTAEDSRGNTIYTLRHWKEGWWAYDGCRYVQISTDNLKAAMNLAIKREFNRLAEERLRHANPEKAPPTSKPVTSQTVGNALHAVQALTSLPDNLDQPAWLGGSFAGRHPRDFVSLTNGILDVSAAMHAIEEAAESDPFGIASGDSSSKLAASLAPHSPLWFAPTALPYQFDADADCPQWRSFLETNLEGDEESIAMLQEWFGYCLTPDASFQKFLMMEGEGRNGKSVICCVLRAILGGDNVSHVPLELFGERFALTQTIGKLANIASEVGEIDRAAEGILKAFVAGDRMTFDRKGIAAIEAVPTARLVFATNNRPRFSDRSTGLWRRMLLLTLTYQVPDGQQIHGMDSAEYWQDELPGIFNWALHGLATLRRNGRFTQSRKSREGVEDYQRETNPARLFLQEQYETDESSTVECDAIYQHYSAWCKASGCSPLNAVHFGREVFRVFRKSEKKRIGERRNRSYVYSGIKKSIDDIPESQSTGDASDSTFPEWSN